MKIKTGDKVRITAGKDKGKTGKVLQVFPQLEKVVVEGVNTMTKHLKKRGNQAGQKVTFQGPIHVSNVRIVGASLEGRVGYKIIERDGAKKKVRRLVGKKGAEDLE